MSSSKNGKIRQSDIPAGAKYACAKSPSHREERAPGWVTCTDPPIIPVTLEPVGGFSSSSSVLTFTAACDGDNINSSVPLGSCAVTRVIALILMPYMTLCNLCGLWLTEMSCWLRLQSNEKEPKVRTGLLVVTSASWQQGAALIY